MSFGNNSLGRKSLGPTKTLSEGESSPYIQFPSLPPRELLNWCDSNLEKETKLIKNYLLEKKLLLLQISKLEVENDTCRRCSLQIVKDEIDTLLLCLSTETNTDERTNLLKEITFMRKRLDSLASMKPINALNIAEEKKKVTLLQERIKNKTKIIEVLKKEITNQEKILIDQSIMLENVRHSLAYMIENSEYIEPKYEMPADWYDYEIIIYVIEFLNNNFYAECICVDYEKEFPGIKKILDNYDLMSDLALKIAVQAMDSTTTEDVLECFQDGKFNFNTNNMFHTFVCKTFLEIISETEMSEIVRLAEIIHMILSLEDETFEVYECDSETVLLQDGEKRCCSHEVGNCENGYNDVEDSECCCHKLYANVISINDWKLNTKLEEKQYAGRIN